MSATFDPAAYVSDMLTAGVILEPVTARFGLRRFSIGAGGTGGISYTVIEVGLKWECAALAHPDWQAAVHDALIAEQVPA